MTTPRVERCRLRLAPSRKHDLDFAGLLVDQRDLFLDHDVAVAANLRREFLGARREPSDHSKVRSQPIGNSAGDLSRRLLGHREYRTDVDLAKHVAVGPVGAGWAEHEVGVPDHR